MGALLVFKRRCQLLQPLLQFLHTGIALPELLHVINVPRLICRSLELIDTREQDLDLLGQVGHLPLDGARPFSCVLPN